MKKKELSPLTPEEYPILYAAEQRRKEQDERTRKAAKAHIDLLTSEELFIIYTLIRLIVRKGN